MTVFLLQYFDRSTVGWVFWPVKIVSHITYTVLKLEGDVKHCSIQSNPILYDSILSVVVIVWGLMGRGVVYNEASCLSAWQFDGYRLHRLMIVPNFVICTQFLPARRYASVGYRDRNVSVRPSVRHAPVLCLVFVRCEHRTSNIGNIGPFSNIGTSGTATRRCGFWKINPLSITSYSEARI